MWLSCSSKILKIKDFDVQNINKINNNKNFSQPKWRGANISRSFFAKNKDIWSLINSKGIVKISENSIGILNDDDYKTFDEIQETKHHQFLYNDKNENILHGFKSQLPQGNLYGYSSFKVVNLNTINKKYTVLKFYPPKEVKNPEFEDFFSIYKDTRNRYWIATTSGIYKYLNKSLIFYSSKKYFKSKPVINIYEDKSKNIWLIHENSLTKIHNDSLTYFGSNEGLNTSNINSFIEFESGDYWISTSEGLFNFDGYNFLNYSIKKGLKNNYVSFFIEDNNGRKIISSRNSLDELKFIGDRVETHNIINYNYIYFPGKNNYFLTRKNILFLQNDENEFLKINLNELEKLNRSLKINLDKIYINDKLIDFKNLQEFRNSDTINYSVNDIELDQIKFTSINSRYNYPNKLKLPYDYNHITFFFDGIKWENQSNVNYEYKIDKLDKKWRNSIETRAEYRNLPPGKHKFMIRGKSSFSDWSKPFIYEFTITPPWWKTWYARLAYIIIVILLIWRIIKYRTQSLEKKQKELELEVAKATDEIQTAYITLEEQHNEIKDSIKYAKRIQNAILPNVELMKENFKDCYVLYMPKDVVAGDFFWMEKIDDSIYFAAADCTGHGVPGAMISVICSNALSKALLEDGIRSTGKLLDKTRELVIQNLAKSGEEVKDGMDISLCCLNLKTRVLYSSGANNPVLILRKESSDFDIIKADRQPVGLFSHAKPFKEHKTQLEKGDKVYIFTDGYQDQFGGEKGKKLMPKKFKKLLLDSNQLSMEQQKETLENEFNSWRGELEQIDDVCVIGVEI
jgi:serine phosphatase RsbU (regulator of sigma subunit)